MIIMAHIMIYHLLHCDAVHSFALFFVSLCNMSGSTSSKYITQVQGQLRPMEPEAPRTAPWRPRTQSPSRRICCTICEDSTGPITMISTAGPSIFRGRVATAISVIDIAGGIIVKRRDVSNLKGFNSSSGISVRNIRHQWKLDEQSIREGVNISTRFVTEAGKRLHEDEHILADDSSGHATLTMVRMERSDSHNVDTVDNCLPLCSSCHALVCGLTVEHRSLASGS